MGETTVLTERKGNIVTLRLNRPNALNSMNKELVDELDKSLQKLKDDKEARVVVLTGCGRAFCAGGDLNYLESIAGTETAAAFITQVGGLVKAIMELPQPVIAMVNGAAAGAGFNLALACDFIVAAANAKFAQSFAKVGLVPDCGGMYLLPRLVGLRKAKELMYMAGTIGAEEAVELGLITRLAEPTEIEKATAELAQKLAAGAPLALARMKRALNKSSELSLEQSLALEADLQNRSLGTADYHEGVNAFREKRSPVFIGE